MRSLMLLLEGPLPQSIGWTLIHHLWQATLIAIMAAAGLGLMRRQSANARYLVACAALLLMIVFPLATAWRVYETPVVFTTPEPTMERPLSWMRAVSLGSTAAEPVPLLVRARGLAAPLLPWLVGVWLVGVVILSARLLLGWIHIRRLCSTGQSAPPPWSSALHRLAALLQVRHAVRLLQSSRIKVPMVIGWLRPVVLVPASALTGLSAQQLETILAHELAHIRRHDYLINLAQTLAETLFFYHPAVWWISARIRVERENCCDDLAVAVCGNAVLYARALANLEGLRADAHAVAVNGGTLRERVMRLVSVPPAHCSYRWVAGVSFLTLLAAVAIAAPITLLSQEARSSRNAEESAADMPAIALLEEETKPVTSTEPLPAVPGQTVEEEAKSHDETATAWQPEEFEIQGSEIEFTPGIGVTIKSVGTAPPEISFTLTNRELARISRAAARELPVTLIASSGAPPPPTPPARQTRQRSRRWDGELTIDQLIALKEAGVDAKFIRDLRALGYGDLSFEDLIDLRQQGVDPEYIAKMNHIGRGHLAAEQLVELRNAGVTPTYVEEMTRAGLDNLSVDELIEARSHGLTGSFVEALREAGLQNLSMKDIIRLHTSGITLEFVRELKQTRKKKDVGWMPPRNHDHKTTPCSTAARSS
jgi:beta-lactamase regulating signal transducer with metallopeptidase domain